MVAMERVIDLAGVGRLWKTSWWGFLKKRGIEERGHLDSKKCTNISLEVIMLANTSLPWTLSLELRELHSKTQGGKTQGAAPV